MIRAKFTCQQNNLNHETQTATVILTPVTANPPNEENLTFWQATPAGEITLQIDNPLAVERFILGREYYVDFTLCPAI